MKYYREEVINFVEKVVVREGLRRQHLKLKMVQSMEF